MDTFFNLRCLVFAYVLGCTDADSAIDDELAHIPAGYGYVSQLDYRLNPEHPPLVKALAMLPILFLHPDFPTQSAAWQTQVNGEWGVGAQFLYGVSGGENPPAAGQSPNNANEIIQTARIFPILITILTIILLYLLGRRILGDWWALLPATMFALDPTILAHGHYVTTDVAVLHSASFSQLIFSLKFIETPSTKNPLVVSLAFGVAQLAKVLPASSYRHVHIPIISTLAFESEIA